MQTDVMLPSPAVDFDFEGSNCTSPYLTAPSSPQRFTGFFHSAPTSPGRAAGIPFTWEKEPGIPKSEEGPENEDEDEFDDTDFAFDFNALPETSPLPAADQLFSGGKIRPLKPPPKFHYDHNRPLDSPKSPKSPTRLLREALSPRRRSKPTDFDPFTAALEKTRQRNSTRGRDASRNNKPSRSLSPYRVSDLLFDDPGENPPPPTSIFSSWYRKWRIKDLLLFRSASESRATEKPRIKKYAMLSKTRPEDVRTSSFRSTDSGGSISRRRSSISAHELHYTENRAASEEMKKRTTLAYRQGLWGCLGFHPTAAEISRGITSSGSLSRP